MDKPTIDISLPPALVRRVFPFLLVLDGELRVRQFGTAMRNVCPDIADGALLTDLFSIFRPRVKPSFEQYAREVQTIFLLDAQGSGIRLRGQMALDEQSGHLLFIGGPWFSSVEQLQQSGLHLKDFSVHDPMVDFLYMVQTAQLALEDARRFSDQVTKQRDELEATNQELARANAAKSQFLANTSHELRTPLNGIIGMASLLSRTRLDTVQKNYAVKVISSAEALLRVVNDILDFSKIEAGKMTVDVVPFDLWTLLCEVADLFAVPALQKGVEVVCDLGPGLPRHVQGDPLRLRQVLNNLIGNAIKFTDQGAVVVRATPAEGSLVRVEVIDTGIGIGAAEQQLLFQPFSQVDGSMTRRHGGTGLGLAIASQLVSLMGGQVGLQSEPGQGSTFWFTVDVPSTSDVAAGSAVHDLSGVRCLVIDDVEPCALVTESLLTRRGARCTRAGDAMSALAALRQGAAAGDPYQIAVLDAQMPIMTGLDLALILRSDRTLAALRIVFTVPMDHDAQERLAAHPELHDGVLVKPLRPWQLDELLAQIAPQQPAASPPRVSRPLAAPPRPTAPPRAPAPIAAPAPTPLQVTEPAGAYAARPGSMAPRAARAPQVSRAGRAATAVSLIAVDDDDVPLLGTDPAASLALAPDRPTPRVLVVDDNPLNQEVAAAMVQSLGYRVDIVDDGRAAVSATERTRYDLVLTDLQMPVMDGYEATAAIRQREGSSRHTPIIAMTAHAMESDRQRAMSAGLDDYIAKPVNFQVLSELLQRWVPFGDAPASAEAGKL